MDKCQYSWYQKTMVLKEWVFSTWKIAWECDRKWGVQVRVRIILRYRFYQITLMNKLSIGWFLTLVIQTICVYINDA